MWRLSWGTLRKQNKKAKRQKLERKNKIRQPVQKKADIGITGALESQKRESGGDKIINCVTQYFPELKGLNFQTEEWEMVTASEFSTLEAEKQWSNALKEHCFQPKILSPAKLLIKGKDRIKTSREEDTREVLKYLPPRSLSQEATRGCAPLKERSKPRKQKTLWI